MPVAEQIQIHVMPDWQDHETGPSCWCQPIYEADPLGGRVWLHRAAHDDPHRYTEANDPALRRRSQAMTEPREEPAPTDPPEEPEPDPATFTPTDPAGTPTPEETPE